MRFYLSRPVLAAVAVAFAVSLLLYAGVWMITVRTESQPDVQLGFDNEYQPAERVELITAVYKDSPAEKAGMLPGDRIVAIDGMRITDQGFQTRIWMQHKPGDQIHLTIRRRRHRRPSLSHGRFPPAARERFLWQTVEHLVPGALHHRGSGGSFSAPGGSQCVAVGSHV